MALAVPRLHWDSEAIDTRRSGACPHPVRAPTRTIPISATSGSRTASCSTTRVLERRERCLSAVTLKTILTGQNLPPELASEAATSPLLGQYSPAQPNALARPNVLTQTDLTNAFVPDAT